MGRNRKSNPLGLPKRVYWKDGSFRYVDRTGKWHTLGREWDRAARDRWSELDTGEVIVGTVSDLLDRFLHQWSPKHYARRTHLDNETNVVRLKKTFGRMRIRDVKRSHVAMYLDKHPAPVRANREVATLSSAYGVAMRWGLADENPCHGVRRNRENARTRSVSDVEFASFLKFAEDLYRQRKPRPEGIMALVVTAELAYLTAQRRQDILALRLSDIGDDGLLITQLKPREPVRVLIQWTDRLRAAVDKAKTLIRPVRGMTLICNRHGQQYTDAGFKSMWNRLQVRWAEAGNERFHFHDLRAKATSDLKDQGRYARDLTGHRTEATAERIYDRRKVRKAPAVK